jgi:hypothetical protein
MVVTSQSPFLVLGASAALGRLLGAPCQELRGLNLDCLVAPDEEAPRKGGQGQGQGQHQHQQAGLLAPKRSALLSSFYKDMLQPERAHLVAYLVHADGFRIKCSVSSFPVYCCRDDPALDSAANAEAFRRFKETVPDSDELMAAAAGSSNSSSGHDGAALGHVPQYFGLLFSRLDQ